MKTTYCTVGKEQCVAYSHLICSLVFFICPTYCTFFLLVTFDSVYSILSNCGFSEKLRESCRDSFYQLSLYLRVFYTSSWWCIWLWLQLITQLCNSSLDYKVRNQKRIYVITDWRLTLAWYGAFSFMKRLFAANIEASSIATSTNKLLRSCV